MDRRPFACSAGLAPQKLVDLILLAHDDELVVTVHNQLFRTVFEFLARRFDTDHGDAEPFMHARILDGVTDDMRGVWIFTTLYAPSSSM